MDGRQRSVERVFKYEVRAMEHGSKPVYYVLYRVKIDFKMKGVSYLFSACMHDFHHNICGACAVSFSDTQIFLYTYCLLTEAATSVLKCAIVWKQSRCEPLSIQTLFFSTVCLSVGLSVCLALRLCL